ncbi:MAG: cache domain-containing protein [Acidimicrobiia bacterium]|nr:cache domain-containing protein [Acidimicrobiia bacterium]
MSTPADGLALPTTERPEPVTPRTRRRRWSLRAHLIAVVLVTIALVVLSGVLVISKDYQRARAEGALNAKFEAGLAAGITGRSKTAGAESISGSMPDLRALIVRSGTSLGQATNGNLAAYPPDRCNLSFASFRSFTSGVLAIVFPDGSVLCSSSQSLVVAGTHPYAGAEWLTPVIDRNAATIVGPLVDPLTNKSSLFVAAPIPSPNAPPDAKPPGALVVAVDLTPLATTLHERFAADRYPANSLEYLITTAKRDKVVSRSIQPERSIGKPLNASAYARADSPKGAVLKDLNGTERLYVGQAVDELNWHVYAGISTSAVYRPARAALRDYVTSGLIIVLGVGLFALAGIFTVARR